LRSRAIEAPVLAALVHPGNEDVDGGFDDPGRVELARTGAAQHVAKCAERLVDEHQSEGFHRLEVPIERRGHDAGFAGDFAQAQGAEAALLEES